jgi:3-oxoacyl-[acyl-carrier-protein] synthase III
VQTICLSAIEYVHGEPHSVAELEEPTSVDLTTITRDVATYRVSDQSVWELAATVGARTLACGAGPPPDLMLYVTENDHDPAGSLASIAAALDLPETEYLVLSGYHCGNLGPALQVAQDAIGSGRRTRVLLLLADRAKPGERIMSTGLSLLSDGAASCLITGSTSDAVGQRFVMDATTTAVRMESTTDLGQDQGILGTVALAASSIKRIAVATGREPGDYQHLILGNYRIASQRFMAAAVGMGQKLVFGAVADLGHCFSADILITLDQRRADGTLAEGDLVLAAATGTYSWSTTSFQCW